MSGTAHTSDSDSGSDMGRLSGGSSFVTLGGSGKGLKVGCGGTWPSLEGKADGRGMDCETVDLEEVDEDEADGK